VRGFISHSLQLCRCLVSIGLFVLFVQCFLFSSSNFSHKQHKHHLLLTPSKSFGISIFVVVLGSNLQNGFFLSLFAFHSRCSVFSGFSTNASFSVSHSLSQFLLRILCHNNTTPCASRMFSVLFCPCSTLQSVSLTLLRQLGASDIIRNTQSLTSCFCFVCVFVLLLWIRFSIFGSCASLQQVSLTHPCHSRPIR